MDAFQKEQELDGRIRYCHTVTAINSMGGAGSGGTEAHSSTSRFALYLLLLLPFYTVLLLLLLMGINTLAT